MAIEGRAKEIPIVGALHGVFILDQTPDHRLRESGPSVSMGALVLRSNSTSILIE